MADISINTQMDMFKNNLINVIGDSQLPIGVTYYILKDVYKNIEMLYNQTLEKEQQELVASMEKEKEEAEKEDIENYQE